MRALLQNVVIYFTLFLSCLSYSRAGNLLNKDNQQLWINGIVGYQFSKLWLLDTELAYNQSFQESNRWKELAFTPIVEYYKIKNVDLLGGMAFSFVRQQDGFRSFENRWIVGARHHITPESRFYLRHLLRFESRFFFYSDETRSSHTRSRYRVELLSSITGKSYQDDQNLYLITDFEMYFNFTNPPKERYAFQNRARLGIGFKPNPKWKIEYLFVRQNSDNNLDEGTNSSIETTYTHRIMIKFYPKAKPNK